MKNAIVITGNIGSGKSTVGNFLKLYGYEVIDADKINHQILDENVFKISEFCGSEIVNQYGKMDRLKLSHIVFNDNKKLKLLEDFLHPKIQEEIYALADEQEKTGKVYFVDIPLFYETNNYEFEKVLLVYAPKETCIERTIKRNLKTKDEVLKIYNKQIDIEEKSKKADYIIDNSHDIHHLQAQIEAFLEKIKK